MTTAGAALGEGHAGLRIDRLRSTACLQPAAGLASWPRPVFDVFPSVLLS